MVNYDSLCEDGLPYRGKSKGGFQIFLEFFNEPKVRQSVKRLLRRTLARSFRY